MDSLEIRLEGMLQDAARMLQRAPDQAMALASEIKLLAKGQRLDYYLAAATKIGGNVHFLYQEYQLAEEQYLAALEHAGRIQDPKLSRDIHYNLGRVYIHQRDYQAALQHLHTSLAIRQNLELRQDQISSLNHIGQVYWETQDYLESASYFQQAILLCDASINARQTATLYNNLGNALIKTGEVSQALEAYAYSLELKESFGDAFDLATANLNLGNLYHTTSDFPAALRYYLEAERLYMVAGDQTKAAIVCSNLGATYNCMDDPDLAMASHQRALEVFKGSGMTENYAKTLNNIGNIHLNRGEYLEAIDCYNRALELKHEHDNPESLALTLNNLSESYYCLGEYPEALEATRKSMIYSTQINAKTLLLNSYSQLGKIFAALHDFENAYEALNSFRILDLEVYRAGKNAVLAEKLALYDLEGKSKEIATLKSDQHALEALLLQQQKDKRRYLKLYRSKLDEVKKRMTAQDKLEQLNADLETRIQQAIQNYQDQQQIIIQKSKLESLGVMAAGMAHEINQPLSAISMSINNLLIKARKNELSDEYLDDKTRKITDDIQRIRNVIEHVRQFSRDQININPERVDIHRVIDSAIELIAYDLSKHRIQLQTRFHPQALITVGSKFKLEQVFLNLIVNARDAILEKERRVDTLIWNP